VWVQDQKSPALLFCPLPQPAGRFSSCTSLPPPISQHTPLLCWRICHSFIGTLLNLPHLSRFPFPHPWGW
jgi:hypothetical protein